MINGAKPLISYDLQALIRSLYFISVFHRDRECSNCKLIAQTVMSPSLPLFVRGASVSSEFPGF
jgi:hypothetical protein